MRAILSSLGVAAAMLAVSGCCDMQQPPTQSAYPSAVVPLLCDGVSACPPPHLVPGQPIALRLTGAPEERVYDLGEGLVANTSAVKLAGGREKPIAKYRAGGVGCTGIAPSKPSTYTAPKVVGTATVTPVPVSAPTPYASSQQGMVYGFCPVPEGSEAVCLPGEFLSECFTLTDSEKQGGPDIYIPGVTSKYDAALDQASAVVTEPTPSAAAVSVDSTAGSVPAVAAPSEPVSTAAIPAAPGVDSGDRSEALREVESLKESPLAAPVPAPEVAPTTTAPLAPPIDTDDPVAALPPVPVVTDLNQVAETMSPTPADPSNLPEVQLPPKLN